MPLEFLYRDVKTKEENRFLIKVLLEISYPTSNTISEHPSETKTSFIDNSIENLKEINCSVFIPHREEIEKNQSELTQSSNFLTNVNNFGLTQNKSITNITFKEGINSLNTQDNIQEINNIIKYRYKNEVYNFLQYLKNEAIILTLFTGDEFFDGKNYIIKEINYNKSIETGNGMTLDMVFLEANFVSPKIIQLTKEQVQRIKALIKQAEAYRDRYNSDSSLSSIRSNIYNNNKTSKQINKGSKNLSNTDIVENIRSKNPYAKDILLPVKGGKYILNEKYIDLKNINKSALNVLEKCSKNGAKGYLLKQ